jgi:DNA-binding response OmpR family regulator
MGLRILLVEDHEDTRHTLWRLLRNFDYEVATAPDYQAARSILDGSQFDVLLSDICLPDGDGCDLVIEAKSKQSLVAIGMSALGSAKDEERGFSCGFDHYFVKPLDFRRLHGVLNGTTAQPNW